jgi:hypothetical protein
MNKLNLNRLTIIVIITFALYSCSNLTDKKITDKTKTHQRLIDCKSKYVMECGEELDGDLQDYEKLKKEYFSVEQNGDTLIVTTLNEVNSCGKTIGFIEFSGDSLFLKTRQIADDVCTSTMFEKFTYRILNPDKIKYKIRSER